MMSSEEKVVCVTGASGFIASWVVKLLLQRGYTVRATVRDPNDPKKMRHLMELDGAKQRLQLFKAELLEAGSFDPVVHGCRGVFHTASPVILSDTADPQAELIEPAVKGTLNVLGSCAKVPSLKRVVVTSSMAAIIFNGRPLGPDVVVDESWFSDPSFARSPSCFYFQVWYMLSKTSAEEAAWKFAKVNGIDLVTINPGYTIGPILQPTLNTSTETIFKLVNGSETYRNSTLEYVDVRDVAMAHILAFENPSASGRYCLAGRVAHCREIIDMLHELYPLRQLPEKCEDDKNFRRPTFQVSREKAKALGVEFTPLEVTLKDTVECLKAKGFV